MLGEARVIEGPFGRATALWPGNDLVPHAHKEAHIIIPLGGSPTQVFFVDSELYSLDPDNGFLINPLEVHSFHAASPEDHPSFLVFYIQPGWFALRHGLPVTRPFANRQVRLNSDIARQARSLVEAILYGYALEDMLVVELELFIDAVIASARLQENEEQLEPLSLPRSDFRIRKAMQFMQQNLDSRYTLDCVARHVGLSRPHFFSLFLQQIGMTPRIYWNVLRIEKALNELKSPSVQLGSLAYDLGFSSQGNFSRFFRERTGVSPMCYRRAVQ